MLAALILALALPVLAAPAEPQIKAGGVIRGRITNLDSGKLLRRAPVRLPSESDFLGTPRTASTSTDDRYTKGKA